MQKMPYFYLLDHNSELREIILGNWSRKGIRNKNMMYS